MTFNVKHLVLPAMAVLLLAASPRPAAAQDGAAKADAPKTLLQKRVDRAVKRAVDWFRKTQNVKGKGVAGAWSFREPNWESGVTSLVLFALLKSGVDREDAMVKAGFKYIADNVSPNKRPTEMYTYNVATQMLAIEAGYGDMLRSKNPGNPVEKTLRDIFDANFEYCKKALKAGEAGYTIDQEGIGQLIQMSVEKGRKTRSDLKIGICGEQGGDPASVEFCYKTGLTYVSCSPFRVPIARLAAAQAAIKADRKK